MQQSVIYQDILQKGLQQGLQQGEETLIVRQLTPRLGKIPLETQQRIRGLSTTQLEELGDALLDFTSQHDLTNYFANIPQPPKDED